MGIYLDCAATTPVRPEVKQAMLPFLDENFGNPSSVHRYAEIPRMAIEHARQQVAAAIGAHRDEIIFTPGGTLANNLAILGYMKRHGKPGEHVITTQIEHPSVLEPFHQLEKSSYHVTYLPVDAEGRVNPQELREALREDTRLVSIMFANNETGVMEPIEEIATLLRQRKIALHTDAVQAVGKCKVDVKRQYVDMLSFSGHKLFGPKGVGVLFLRRGVTVAPLYFGGGQEMGIISGTMPAMLIAGMGEAAALAAKEQKLWLNHALALRNLLERRLLVLPGITINSPMQGDYLPNICNISVEGIEGQLLLLELDRRGIAVSSGSACQGGKNEPSHVLLAMGKSQEEALSSIRISFGYMTRKEDIDALLDVLTEIVTKQISTSYKIY